MPNAQNVDLVSKIESDLKEHDAMWVVDYRGLTVKQIQQLRRNVREADGFMKVYKNTLMHIALDNTDSPNMDEILEGPSAFVFAGEDPLPSAKALRDFAQGNENLQIKGGMMNGEFLDAAQVDKLASLPSHDQLIAKLLGTISNPLSNVVRVLDAIRKQKEEEAAA